MFDAWKFHNKNALQAILDWQYRNSSGKNRVRVSMDSENAVRGNDKRGSRNSQPRTAVMVCR